MVSLISSHLPLVADEDDWELGTNIIDPSLHCCITIQHANLPQLEYRLLLILAMPYYVMPDLILIFSFNHLQS